MRKINLAVAGCLAITIVLYLTRLGGSRYVLLTDILTLIFAIMAVAAGVQAMRIYGKSLQGQALKMLTLGVGIWALAELVWLLFFSSAYVVVETLRFVGYVPLILAFVKILKVSDPAFRRQRRKWVTLFGGLLIFSGAYLLVLPTILGEVAFWDNFTNNGYVLVDFILLFGIFLLLRTTMRFSKGSLAEGWLILAMGFLSLLIFDIYFAFQYASYAFGDFIEIFWVITYLLLALGFWKQYSAMKNMMSGKSV
jgi:hypothetical protein